MPTDSGMMLGREWWVCLGLAVSALMWSGAGAGTAPQRSPTGADGVEFRVDRVLSDASDLGRSRLVSTLFGKPVGPIFSRPYGIAWLGDRLVISDPGAGQVVVIDGKKIRRSRPGLFKSPVGVATCDEMIVVSDSIAGTVTLLDPKLTVLREIAEGLDRPTGIACMAGHVYVVETGAHRVVAFPLAKSTDENDRIADPLAFGKRGQREGEFNFPTVLAATPGSLWVGDTLNFRLQRIDPSTGEVIKRFGRIGDSSGDMPRIKGVAVDSAGRIWTTDAILDQISVHDSGGRLLAWVGAHGGLPGEFSFPAGIAIHEDGRIAVADSLNRRVQILRLVGSPTAGGIDEVQ